MSPVPQQDRVEVGVLGLEATHVWMHGLQLVELPGPLVLNARGRDIWPRYVLRRIGGLHSGPERIVAAEPLVGRIGAARRPSKLAGKSVSYEGTAYARTLGAVRQARLALLTAFSVQSARTMRVLPHPDYADGTEHVYSASVLACECEDVQALGPTAQPTPFARDFVIGLQMDDPRTYSPVALEDSGTTVQIANGPAPTDCVIDVAQPSQDFTITGGYGALRVVGVNGATARLDLVRGEVTVGGLPSGRIDDGVSTMLDAPAALPPGDSELRIVGAAGMSVTYRRAFW